MDDFRVMADGIEHEIRSGRLRSGTRLAPQREFARSHGIATSTAARVYQELERRGLVSGEIGRGTYVLGGSARTAAAAPDPGRSLVDLEANFPVLPSQPAMLATSLGELLNPTTLDHLLQPVGAAGGPAERHTVAAFLARPAWSPDPDNVLFTGSGRQSIAAAVAALVPAGGRLGVEEFTYPVVKAIAANLGVTLVPLAMDDDGLVPAALAQTHLAAPLGAVYVQPTLHNPLGVTMSTRRRQALAATLDELSLTAIEDGVNCFLRDDRPLAAYAPARTVYVDSLSKRVAPGLNLGVTVAPPGLREPLSTAIRSGTWTASGLVLAAATALIADGTADRIVALKRDDATTRQAIVLHHLAGFVIRADPAAYHSWWELPDPWQPETFVSAAARHGIAISPAAAFAVAPTGARAVRLSNSSPTPARLAQALDVLADLARRTPEDTGLDY